MIKVAGCKQTLIREGWAFCFCKKIAHFYTNLLLCTNGADEQTNSAIRRGTIYWRIADLSALGGGSHVPLHFHNEAFLFTDTSATCDTSATSATSATFYKGYSGVEGPLTSSQDI